MYMGQATAQILKLNDFPFYRSSSSQVAPIKGSWHICYSCRKLNYGHSKSNLTLAIDFSKTLLRNLLQPPWSSSESKGIIYSFQRADVSECNKYVGILKVFLKKIFTLFQNFAQMKP